MRNLLVLLIYALIIKTHGWSIASKGGQKCMNACVGVLGLLSVSCTCMPAAASAAAVTFVGSGNSFTFKYTDDLELKPKLVKTHDMEVFLKSKSIKNFNAGLTVDKVKVSSVKQFGLVSDLAQRVIAVEKAKEGVFEAEVVGQAEAAVPAAAGFPVYDLEYKIDSSRGAKHFLVKSTIVDNKLYVFTVQTAEGDFASLSRQGHDILDSFKIKVASTSPVRSSS